MVFCPLIKKHKLLLCFSSSFLSMVKTTVVRREKIRKMIFFASLVSINKLCFISRREWGKILAGRHKLFAPFDGWADKRKAAKRNLRIKQENNFIVNIRIFRLNVCSSGMLSMERLHFHRLIPCLHINFLSLFISFGPIQFLSLSQKHKPTTRETSRRKKLYR